MPETSSPASPQASPQSPPVTIKKYANRRLYNTATSSYVTLENLAQMVKDGIDFVVYDAKSGDDITRGVLTQIIVEEEGKGQNLLPTPFLRQLIGFYGDQMQWLVPSYLEATMKSFSRNQEQMRDYFKEAFGGMFPFGSFEQMGKQNMTMMEQAMRFWNPFAARAEGQLPFGPMGLDPAQTLDIMRRQLEELQKQIAVLKSAEAKKS